MSLYEHFSHALQLSLSERVNYLRSIENQALVTELEELFVHHDSIEQSTNWHDLVAKQVAHITGDHQLEQLLGQSIGPYKLTEVIGRGGMGIVFKADREDGTLEQSVAIKFLFPSVNTLIGENLAHSEAQYLAKLNHPNITQVFDAGTTDSGLHYFIMELVNGITIDQYVQQQALAPKQITALMLPVCDAIAKAHLLGIAHTDLKPSNILINADGIPKVLDFGIAKLIHNDMDGKQPGVLHGYLRALSVNYASPEQLKGERFGLQTDQYSLGCLLYFLLTQSTPFEDSENTLAQRLKSEGTSPRPLHKQVNNWRTAIKLSGDLDTIVCKTLQHNAQDRYTSVNELQSALTQYLASEPLEQKRTQPFYRFRKWVQRRPAQAMVFALLTLSSAVFYQQKTEIELQRNTALQVSQQLAGIFKMTDPTQGATPNLSGKEILLKGADSIKNDASLSLEVKSQLLTTIAESLISLDFNQRAIEILTPLIQSSLLKSSHFNLYFKAKRLAIDAHQHLGDNRHAQLLAKQLFSEFEHRSISAADKFSVYKKFLDSGLSLISQESFRFYESTLASFKSDVIKEDNEQYWAAKFAEYDGYSSSINSAYFYGEISQQEYATKRAKVRNLMDEIEQGMPDSHPDFARFLMTKAYWLAEEGIKCRCSDPILAKLPEYTSRYGEHHPRVRGLYANLAYIAEYEQNYLQAIDYYQHVLTIDRENHGENSLDYLTDIDYFAKLNLQVGNVALVEKLLVFAHQTFAQLDKNTLPLEINVGYFYALNSGIAMFEATDQYDKAYPYILEAQKLLASDPIFHVGSDFRVESMLIQAKMLSLTDGPQATLDYLITQIPLFEYPNNFELNFEMARQLYLLERYEDSISYFRQAIPVVTELIKNYPTLYFQNIGIQYVKALVKAGKTQEAQQEFGRIWAFNVNANPARQNYWLIMLRQMATQFELDVPKNADLTKLSQ